MKRLLLFLAVLIGFSGVASAQFSYNDVKLYFAVGGDIENASSSSVSNYIFAAITTHGLTYVRCKNAGDIKYDINHGRITVDVLTNPEKALKYFLTCIGFNMNKAVKYESTHSKYYVYKYNDGINYAFSRDLKSMIKWNDGKENNRRYYRLVDPSELEPKAANLDFLYE